MAAEGEAPAAAPSAVLTGTVKWFNSTKGFGFITPDDGSEEIFVHQTSIKAEGFRSLAEGEPVEYTVEKSEADGRTKALNVTGPGGAPVRGAPRRDSYGGGRGYGGPREGGRMGGGRGMGAYGGGPGVCYSCNMPGHIARECPNAVGGGGGSSQRTCYSCNLPGHIARDCPNVAVSS